VRGVWYTTGGGAGVLTAAGIAAGVYGAAWVLAHLVLILAVGAGCAVLTAVAIRLLISWSDQHAIQVWAQRPVQLHVSPVTQVPPAAARAAVAPVATFNFYNLNPAEQAMVIRNAISRTPSRWTPPC
jgi:hypothetical protein